ncbi:MAG: hypothetical protein ACI31V_05155 [Bacilli bacterium]
MEDKIFKYVISFILCVILFVSETLLLIQYNVSKGIRKEDVIKIIDNVNLEDEIKELNSYDKLEEKLNREVLNEIINSDELNRYVKENAKSIYLKTIYGEKVNYISNEELKLYINNKVEQLEELNEITETDKIEILNIVDEITKEVENGIEETSKIENMNIIEKIMSNKTTTYILLITIFISATIILINKSKTGLIFAGLPTIITGVLFLILELTLTRKISSTGIDRRVIYAVNNYLPNMIKTLKKSSIIMTSIGFIECALYTILNYQEVGNKDGEI